MSRIKFYRIPAVGMRRYTGYLSLKGYFNGYLQRKDRERPYRAGRYIAHGAGRPATATL
jgi:hypothetical protein